MLNMEEKLVLTHEVSSEEILEDMESIEKDLSMGLHACNSEEGKCSLTEVKLLRDLLYEMKNLKEIVKEMSTKR